MDIRLKLLEISEALEAQQRFAESDELHMVVSQLLPTKGIFRSPNSKGTLRSKMYSLHSGKVYDKNGNIVGHNIDKDGNIYHESSTEPVGRLKEKSVRIYRKKKDETTTKPTLEDNAVFQKDRKGV